MRRCVLLASLLTFSWIANVHAENIWPQFRGPNGSGIATGSNLPTSWSKDQNILWQITLPGRGWSSPVVWGNRVFVTSVINDKTPPPRKGLYITDLIGKIPPGEHRWVVSCLDRQSGKVLWEKTAHTGTPKTAIHLKNTYASETPVTDGKRVYAYFGNVGVYCYDFSGKELWSRKLGAYKTKMGWGTGASPVVYKDRLYVLNDNEEKSFLAALDVKTGDEIWRVERDEKSNWSTPFIWENRQRTEIVTAGSGKVRSYSLDGKLLWELRGMSLITIPTPIASADLLYISSGYVIDLLRPVYAIRPGASGDISLKKDETSNKSIAWCQKLAGPYHPTPLVYQNHLYVLYDKGFLACYDARTGKEVYKKQRLGANSDKFTASPWAYNGKIFCLSEDGDTYVIKAGAEFKILGINALDEMSLATPAVTEDGLILRTASKLYYLKNGAKKGQ
jgi:outer membrane protein assembly factor BamB